jgi:hypothetical protein
MRAVLCDCCNRRIKTEGNEKIYEIEIRKGDGEITERNGFYKKEICEACAKNVEDLLNGKDEFRGNPIGVE